MTEAEQQAVVDIRNKMILDNPLRVIEAVDTAMPPFEQKSHTLMIAAVDTVAVNWITELKRIREQTTVLEAMVIAQCDRVKDHITRMHLLGVQTMREAERTADVNRNIADELDRMMEKQEA